MNLVFVIVIIIIIIHILYPSNSSSYYISNNQRIVYIQTSQYTFFFPFVPLIIIAIACVLYVRTYYAVSLCRGICIICEDF